jgi:hypothetical protein
MPLKSQHEAQAFILTTRIFIVSLACAKIMLSIMLKDVLTLSPESKHIKKNIFFKLCHIGTHDPDLKPKYIEILTNVQQWFKLAVTK